MEPQNNAAVSDDLAPELNSALIEFLENYLIEKELFFTEQDANRFPVLIRNGVIKTGNMRIGAREFQFTPPAAFIKLLHDHFSEKLSLPKEKLPDVLSFVEQVGEELHGPNSQGLLVLLRDLTKFLVDKGEQSGNINLCTELALMSKKDGHYFELLTNFKDRMQDAQYAPAEMWGCLKSIATQIGSPKSYDGMWGGVARAIVEYVKLHPKDGLYFYNLAIEDCANDDIINLTLSSLQGLFEAGMVTIADLQAKLGSVPERIPATIVLANNLKPDEQAANDLLDELAKVSQSEKPFAYRRSTLLTAIDRQNKTSTVVSSRVHQELLTQLESDDPDIVANCFEAICLQPEHSEMAMKTIRDFVGSDHFLHTHITSLQNTFLYSENIDLYFDTLELVAAKQELKFDHKAFEHSAIVLRDKDVVEFDRRLVNLIINNEGYLRFAGIHLLDDIKRTLPQGKLAYNLLSLSMVQQYQFANSMSYAFMQPEEIIPIILPLKDTPHPIVRELFLTKLEDLYKNFGSVVIEELENKLSETNNEDNEIIERLKLFKEEVKKVTSIRSGCKELSSIECYTLQMREYQRYYQVQVAKVKAAAEQNSVFHAIASHTTLARGGGWKPPGSDVVRKLETGEFSMRMPSELIKNQVRYNAESAQFFRTNWKNDYEQWAQTI